MTLKQGASAVMVVVFLLPIRMLNAQTNQSNLRKYWHYRYRLVNDFMVVGGNQGESLPAFARNLYDDNSLAWGEVPRYLGWYLGVLATEYKLLQNNGQDVNRTMLELHYALMALERLDWEAEPAWGKPATNLNGFMIRDDVPSDFVSAHSKSLNDNILDVWPPFTAGSGGPSFVKYVISEAVTNGLRNPTSMDQYSELLMGLALVKKCVNNAVLTFPDENGTPLSDNLRQRAIDEADRIVSFLRDGASKLPTAGDGGYW